MVKWRGGAVLLEMRVVHRLAAFELRTECWVVRSEY
jgi:hypothetical protein